MVTKAKKLKVPNIGQLAILDLDRKINELEHKLAEQAEVIARQDDTVNQALDQLREMEANADLYKKLVNHLLAAVNILARGAKNG